MAINADDDLPPRPADADVQPGRDDAGRVVQQAYTGISRGVGQHRFARAVPRHPVHNQNLQPVGRVLLGQHRAETTLDVGRFVADRHDDRDQWILHALSLAMTGHLPRVKGVNAL